MLKVHRFTLNNVGVLDWFGVAADAEVWRAWEAGYAYDPDRVAFGLHMSM